MEGAPPPIFTGNRTLSDTWMQNLRLYQFTNADTHVMQDPYRKVAHALTFVGGPAVDEWKRNQMNWIVNRPIPTPPHVNVWDEFQSNFT